MRFAATILAVLVVALPARAEPALWVVQSPTAKIYLFGTMHILPKPADWFGPKIAAAFKDSSALWEEADIGMNDPNVMSHIMSEAMSQDYDLWSALPSDYADKLRDQLNGCGLNEAVVAHVRPWMAAMMVSICQMTASAGGKLGPMHDNPEAVLMDKAHETAKEINYFETADQQIGYLANAPENAQMGQLRQAIDDASGGKDDYAATESAWVNGDVSAIAKTVDQSRKEDPAFYATVFPERNARFAARIEEMLKANQTAFVAIGAGHLAGPDSVLAVLARQGITAQRLDK